MSHQMRTSLLETSNRNTSIEISKIKQLHNYDMQMIYFSSEKDKSENFSHSYKLLTKEHSSTLITQRVRAEE